MNKRVILTVFLGLLLLGLLVGLGLAVKIIFDKRLEINTLKDTLNKKDVKLIQLEQQIKELNFDKSELERKKNDLGTKIAKLETDLGGLRENEARLKKQIVALEEEKKEFAGALAKSAQLTEDRLKLAAEENKKVLDLKAKQYLVQEENLLGQIQGWKEKSKDFNNQKDALDKRLAEVIAKLNLEQTKFNYYQLGITHEFDKKYSEAAEEYKKIIAIDPQEAYVNFRLANIYTNGIKDADRADYYKNKYVELNNLKDVSSNEGTGSFLELTEKKKVVNVSLDKLTQKTSQVRPPADFQSVQPAEPAETFEDKYFKRRYNLALTYEDTQRYAEAAQEYEKALELEPFNADICYNLGILYDDRIKDKKKAVVYYQKFLELSPEGEDAQKVRNWITRAKDEITWEKNLR